MQYSSALRRKWSASSLPELFISHGFQIAGSKAASQVAPSRHRSVPMEYGGGREYDLEKEFGPVPKRNAEANGAGQLYP